MFRFPVIYLFVFAPCGVVVAATPLNDADLGLVHIVGGDIVAGPDADPATGVTAQEPPRHIVQQPTEQQAEQVLRDEHPVIDQPVEMNRRNGDTQITYQAGNQHIEVSPVGSTLAPGVRLINGNHIDSVLVRDAGGPGANRGDFGLQDLSISHTIQITPGPSR